MWSQADVRSDSLCRYDTFCSDQEAFYPGMVVLEHASLLLLEEDMTGATNPTTTIKHHAHIEHTVR